MQFGLVMTPLLLLFLTVWPIAILHVCSLSLSLSGCQGDRGIVWSQWTRFSSSKWRREVPPTELDSVQVHTNTHTHTVTLTHTQCNNRQIWLTRPVSYLTSKCFSMPRFLHVCTVGNSLPCKLPGKTDMRLQNNRWLLRGGLSKV